MRAASFGEVTGARADVSTLLWGQRAVLRAARGCGVSCGGHRAHRRGLVQFRVLGGHLDQSGLLGGGSTVAWGRRGDRARLHVLINLRPQGRRRSAMWRTRRTRVAQAAGVVQAGVVRTGRHDAGGRAADGVRGTLWVQKEPRCDVRADCYKDIAGFL